MFQLLRGIIRPSSETIQNYLIPSALWDPVALTVAGAIVLWVHVCYYSVYGYLCYYITFKCSKSITYKISIDWKILVYGAGGSPAPYTRIFQSIDIL